MSIKVFRRDNCGYIIFQDTLSISEIESFEGALENSISRYEISFINLKTIPKKIINLLYKKIYIESQTITLYSSHTRLFKYLTSLGFRNSMIGSHNSTMQNMKDIKFKALKSITIGGSAYSLNKIISIVESIPLADIAIFVIQHIKEDAKLILDNILKDKTKYSICYPENGEEIVNGKLYIAPPAKHISIQNGKIILDNDDKVNYARPSLSKLFKSVAEYYGGANITIITCGYGKDGSDALSLLREKGSCVILSDPDECEAKDMIVNAIATREYNHILNTDEIRSFLNTILQTVVDKDTLMTSFLKEIKELYGYDFVRYDRGSVTRRVESLMFKVGINSLPLLVKEVLTKRVLFDELLLSISINVTEFFRKPTLYIAMRELLIREFANTPLKIWVAGSSTGEEPYSIAMVLDDLGMYENSLIYATDFNPTVIDEAKSGLYAKELIITSIANSRAVLSTHTILNYLDSNKLFYTIKERLKKNILFFTHNLVTDGSFKQFDIISCKNVLIYFTPPLQEMVFELFYNSLSDDGYLLLGESESMPQSFTKKFNSYSVKNRIYKKVDL
ncbi:MAG: CheR family methyltransferase [Sulfurovum sp.]